MLAQAFAAAGVPSADLDARVLLCAALGIDHAGLVRDGDAALGTGAARLAEFAARRLKREPVSRIIGWREFFGQPFLLGPETLDPRPDTETVVEAVLAHFDQSPARALRIVDLGVGSGAILCAILRDLPHAFGVGVDLSPAACALARRNIETLGLADRASVLCGDWGEALAGPFDCIVANPPYIPLTEIESLEPEVRDHDPRLALAGGADGLDAYRKLAPEAARLLCAGGLAVFEFGLGQGPEVVALLANAGFERAKFRLDLNGRDRIIAATRPI